MRTISCCSFDVNLQHKQQQKRQKTGPVYAADVCTSCSHLVRHVVYAMSYRYTQNLLAVSFAVFHVGSLQRVLAALLGVQGCLRG
jgi:hypothetical protein